MKQDEDLAQKTLDTLSLNERPKEQAQKRKSFQAEVSIAKKITLKCSHRVSKEGKDSGDALIGDAHLVNCNICGAYFPNSGSFTIRALKRHTNQYKLYTSDILRSLYSQCQQKGQNPLNNLKVSPQYQEVRNLIIDWLVEVCETLRLHVYESAYHGIVILDRFLSVNLRKFKKEMDQSQIML